MQTHRPSFLTCLLLAALVAGVMPLRAQKVGTSSLQFLKVMPTARAAAMGDAYATLAAGPDAMYWNPAGIAGETRTAFSASMVLWLFDTRQNMLAGTVPLGEWGTAGVQLQYVDYGTMDVTRTDRLDFIGSSPDLRYNPGYSGETFSPTAMVIGVSYANRMTDRFSAGLSMKYVQESLWNSPTVVLTKPLTGETEEVNTYTRVFLFDFGMLYNTGYRSVKIGVSIQNFGSQVKFAREWFPAPLAFRFGTAGDLIGPDALFAASDAHRITAAFDIFQPNDYAQQFHGGVEYAFAEALFLRAGYKFNYDNDALTAGAGVRQEISGMPFTVDYSYGAMGDYLPAVHRITVGAQLP